VIPRAHITAWRGTAPWSTDAQIEQDLVLSRTIVELFSNSLLRAQLAFRGGTALHKLFLTPAQRYSEDIDLVQVEAGPIGPIMEALHKTLDPLLGEPRRKQSRGRNTFIYRFDSEIPPITPLRLKVEINAREHFAVLGYEKKNYGVTNPWFTGNTELVTYPIEELLGTKLRALYQRKQGRDLFDLAIALQRSPGFDPQKTVHCFLKYVEHDRTRITRIQFEANLREKLSDPVFRQDISPLLVSGTALSLSLQPKQAAKTVLETFIRLLPDPRAKKRSR
jgi:predicted nucleotidyltransferase component of viral defense system